MDQNCLDGKQLDMLNSTIIVNESSSSESQIESLTTPQYSAISEHSSVRGTPQDIEDWLMQLPEDSHASLSQSQENSSQKMTKEICGLKQNAYGLYDQESRTLKMLQVSFLPDTLKKYSVTFTKWGTMLDGVLYQLQKPVHLTKEKGCGYLPTPNAWDGKRGPTKEYNPKAKSQSGRSLSTYAARVFPTPQSRGWKGKSQRAGSGNTTDCLPNAVGGQLNPEWVEWLMGWPIGHTDLKLLAMDKYQSQWLRHFKSCLKEYFN